MVVQHDSNKDFVANLPIGHVRAGSARTLDASRHRRGLFSNLSRAADHLRFTHFKSGKTKSIAMRAEKPYQVANRIPVNCQRVGGGKKFR